MIVLLPSGSMRSTVPSAYLRVVTPFTMLTLLTPLERGTEQKPSSLTMMFPMLTLLERGTKLLPGRGYPGRESRLSRDFVFGFLSSACKSSIAHSMAILESVHKDGSMAFKEKCAVPLDIIRGVLG